MREPAGHIFIDDQRWHQVALNRQRQKVSGIIAIVAIPDKQELDGIVGAMDEPIGLERLRQILGRRFLSVPDFTGRKMKRVMTLAWSSMGKVCLGHGHGHFHRIAVTDSISGTTSETPAAPGVSSPRIVGTVDNAVIRNLEVIGPWAPEKRYG